MVAAVSHPSKRRGDESEREVQGLIRELLGVPARRKLGAGRQDDCGDIDGVPDWCIQVKGARDNDRSLRDNLREALAELPAQQANAGTTFAAAFIRVQGGRYIVVQTPEMWATSAREASRWERAI